MESADIRSIATWIISAADPILHTCGARFGHVGRDSVAISMTIMVFV
jgi:hypothetical protein